MNIENSSLVLGSDIVESGILTKYQFIEAVKSRHLKPINPDTGREALGFDQREELLLQRLEDQGAFEHGKALIEFVRNGPDGEDGVLAMLGIDDYGAIDFSDYDALSRCYFERDSLKSQQKRKGKRQSRGEITQKEAAALCGVSWRTLQKWESKKEGVPPQGYPGRNDAIAFGVFASQYRTKKHVLEKVRGMERATPTDPKKLEEMESRSAWEED